MYLHISHRPEGPAIVMIVQAIVLFTITVHDSL